MMLEKFEGLVHFGATFAEVVIAFETARYGVSSCSGTLKKRKKNKVVDKERLSGNKNTGNVEAEL